MTGPRRRRASRWSRARAAAARSLRSWSIRARITNSTGPITPCASSPDWPTRPTVPAEPISAPMRRRAPTRSRGCRNGWRGEAKRGTSPRRSPRRLLRHEPDPLVGAVAEGLLARGPAAAEERLGYPRDRPAGPGDDPGRAHDLQRRARDHAAAERAVAGRGRARGRLRNRPDDRAG